MNKVYVFTSLSSPLPHIRLLPCLRVSLTLILGISLLQFSAFLDHSSLCRCLIFVKIGHMLNFQKVRPNLKHVENRYNKRRAHVKLEKLMMRIKLEKCWMLFQYQGFEIPTISQKVTRASFDLISFYTFWLDPLILANALNAIV